MIETVVGAIAGPIFDQLLKAGGAVAQDIKDTYGKVDATNKRLAAGQRYEQRYQQRHGQIKIMPGLMKEAVPLDSIYTAINLLDERDKRYFRTEQELEDLYRKVGKRNFQVGSDQRLDGMEIASQEQFLMVLGGPGIGKSTFLRKIGAETLKPDGRVGQGLIPVLIELKTLKESDINLTTVIAKEFEICGFPAATAFTLEALEQGKLMILLDGLDEVPKQNLNTVIECIENFVDQYDQNHCVASCRIAAYNTSFRRFTDVTIAEFDDDQIQQFIDRWFSSDLDQQEHTAERYWELLSSKEHKATKELAQTPLLLTFLCLVYDRGQTLPSNRSTLYGDALNILLKDWAAQKRLERDPIYEGFHPGLETELLADVAYSSFKDNQLFFPKADIIDKIAVFLADTLDAPKHMDGAAVLKAIEVQQGILVERTTETYSFSHLTIQEYLTALHINSHWDTLGNDLIERHAHDDRWREVFLLMAGVLPGGSQRKLWHGLERAALAKVATSPKIKALVEWANTITNTKHQGLNSRASAFLIASDIAITSARDERSAFLIAVARDRASVIVSVHSILIIGSIVLARPIAIDHALGQEIMRERARKSVQAISDAIEEKLFITHSLITLPHQFSTVIANAPEDNDLSDKWYQWIDSLNTVLIQGFDLTKEMVTLSRKDAQVLGDYLYITELLIRCKESANRVSKAEWQEVEARLLTLQEIPK